MHDFKTVLGIQFLGEKVGSADLVAVKNVIRATRPDGSSAVRVDLTFKHPVKLSKSPKNLSVPIVPGVPPVEPEEFKAIIYFSEDEWKAVKDKYQVGNSIKFSVDGKSRLVFG